MALRPFPLGTAALACCCCCLSLELLARVLLRKVKGHPLLVPPLAPLVSLDEAAWSPSLTVCPRSAHELQITSPASVLRHMDDTVVLHVAQSGFTPKGMTRAPIELETSPSGEENGPLGRHVV